jgi:diguanylate cyclase (GGDEF)-like protein
MDGLELCRSVRATQCPGYVFIILLTYRDSKEDTIAGLEAGADDYLSKPFNPGELKARINTGIRILELERSLREANEEIRKLTFTDPLTGCFNRRYINDRLTEDISRAVRYRHPLSLMMCDIDHFKKVNDLHGHRAGDLVLQEFVSCMQHTIRNNVDWIGRYGGEEFILVLPETDFSGAQVLAERLRLRISRHKTNFENHEIKITVSLGVAGFEVGSLNEKTTADFLISEADRLLYKSKYHGRNQIQSANNKPTE